MSEIGFLNITVLSVIGLYKNERTNIILIIMLNNNNGNNSNSNNRNNNAFNKQ